MTTSGASSNVGEALAGSHPDAQSPRVPERCDLAVIGGGIVGLAVARELVVRHPRATVCLLERENDLAAHQTSHNSGVVHSGVYYTPGSLKAALCVQGARDLYEYCERWGIPIERCGKVIVASRHAELPRLAELERRGRANGVPGLRRLGAGEIRAIEPHAVGVAGLHCPSTGIVDFRTLARAYGQEIVGAGGAIASGCEVTGVNLAARSLRLTHSRGVLETRHAIFCAGAWSDRMAVRAGAERDPAIVPFRGAYLRLRPERRHLVSSLIYPVPDPSLPFLGIHLTRCLDGNVLIGPSALMVGARDAYRLRTVRGRDLLDSLSWPGSWRMLARHWKVGCRELRNATVRSAFVREAARYVPELTLEDVEPAFAGVRAQALSRSGQLVDDFILTRTPRALHVRNAPSPAATSSLAIARHLADESARAFGLGR
jgi:(S)-2-hydroxyglutarate dehydrogenase